ncbi:MAG TPA: hypothetical protein VGL35_08500 [Rhizomicrobium sp.]|jgi:DNA-binding transcriptional regulator YiaG
MYEYLECGLENVWLVNGYTLTRGAPSQAVDITSSHDLRRVIEISVARKFERLTREEFCFLEGSLALSRRALATMFGVREQTVAAWEKQNGPPLWADRLMRAFHRERRGDVTRLWNIFDEESRSERAKQQSARLHRRVFEWRARDGWRETPLPLATAA